MYNKGISKSGDLLDLGTTMDIIEKRGAFYSFEGTRLGQGRENAKEFLENSPAIIDRIEAVIRAQSALAPIQVVIPSEEDEAENDGE